MFTLYDGSRLKFGSKSLRRLSLAMMSLLLCWSFSPELYGHAAAPVAPTAPSGLTATAISNARIDLAWTDNAANEDGFKIEIKVGAAGVYSELDVVGANVNTYSGTGLDAGTQYFYRVRAFNGDGNSAYSNQANATTLPDPPVAPSNLTAATLSNTQITLAWADNSNNEDGFKIERKLNSAVTYTQIATVGPSVTNFTNTGLATNTGYSYRVRAYNTGGNSGYSNAAAATTLPNPPSGPSNLTATTISNKRIDIAWTDNSGDELGFIVERKAGSGSFSVVDSVNANVTAYSNTALVGGTQYTFRVRGYNLGGNSDYTNEAIATTQPDVPTAPTNLTATAASNDQINLAWSDNSSNEDGFKIEVKIGSFGTYSEIDVLSANVSSYASTGLEAGIPYFYRVRAFNVTGNSNYSNEVNAFTLPDPPIAPSGLVATTTSNTSIQLAWTDNSNSEDSYKIERRLTTAVTYTEIGTVNANVTSFTNTGLTPNTGYSYRVRALNGGGTSSYSNVSTATTFPNPPAAPGNLSATTVSNSQIDLGWQDNATNEAGFTIERKAGSGGTYAVIDTVDPNVTNFVSLGLTGNVQYFYRVRAFNTGGTSSYSNEANATTMVDPPGTPTNLTATVLNSDQINLAWNDNASSELGYKIELKTGTSGTFSEIDEVGPNVTTYQSMGLNASTQYFYRVRAFSSTGFSGYSNVADGTTMPDPPNAPSGLAATPVSNAQIDLSWKDNSTSETGFKIERRLNTAATFTQIGTVGPNVTTFSSASLTANTAYTYRVRAYNATGNSPYSNIVSASTLPNAPAPPSNLTAIVENNRQINLAWADNSSNELGFIIERKTGAAGAYAKIDTVNANVTSYPNIDLIGGTQYFYRVLAFNTGGNSAASSEANATTLLDPPDTPTNLIATPASNKRINLAWTDNADNEDGYKIERKTSAVGSAFTQHATVGPNVSTFADTGLTALSTYFYRVVGFNADGQSGYSNEASAKTFPNPPGAPGNLTAAPLSNTKIKLDWTDNASNEEGFKIERRTGATGLFAEVGTVAPNVKTFTDTSLSALTQFFYRVRAHNAGGNSAFSNLANATTLPNPPDAPSNLTAAAVSPKQINLEWADNSDDETGFKIERRASAAAAFVQIATVGPNVTAFADTGLAVNVKYMYRVRAYNAGGNSAFSAAVEAVTLPATPTDLVATVLSNTQIKLDWADNASNEDGYKIERKTGPAGVYAEVATVAANVKTFTDSSLSAITDYFYRVRAFNGGGNSAYSNEATGKTLPNTPGTPGNLTATAISPKQINLAWLDNADNEAGFKIERKPSTAPSFTQIATVGPNVTAFADTGLATNVKYQYRVRAHNSGGHSNYSNMAETTTLPTAPNNLKAKALSNKKIRLDWTDPANNEDGFKIERRTGAAVVFTEVGSVAANIKTFTDSSLTAVTEYFYRVRAFNSGGNSGYSNDVKAKTLPNPPAAPTNLTATAASIKQINLAWSDNAGNEAGFKIERRPSTTPTFAQIATVAANIKAFADTGLVANVVYVYRVRAYNAGGNSAYSNTAQNVTLPVSPSGLTATALSNTKTKLDWSDNSSNEDGFKIERKIGAVGAFAEIATVAPNVKTFADSGLSAVTEYFYRVRAFNTGGNSGYSNEANTTTQPNTPLAPSNLAGTPGYKRINLSWSDNAGNEDGFKIERRLDTEAGFTQIVVLPANVSSYADTLLGVGVKYVYRIRAFNTGGHSPYSGEATATTLPDAPGSLTATTQSNTKINLAWTDLATPEDGFKVERKTGAAGVFAEIASVMPNVKTLADTGLAADTEYFYRVHAFNAGGNSAYSNEAKTTTLSNIPVMPDSLTAKPGKKRLDLAWKDKSNNEDGFKIERKAGAAANFTQIAVLPPNAVAFADTGLGVSTKYAYRIRAFNNGGHSPYSPAVEATTLPNPPAAPTTLAAITSSSSQIDLSWKDNSTNEAGFKIERKLGNAGTFTQIATVGANVLSFSNGNLNANTKYSFRVRAYNAGGNSAYSNIVEATTLPKAPIAPANLAVTVVSFSKLNLAWQDKSANEDSFMVERKLGAAGTFAQIAKLPANAVAFGDTGLSASTQYFYRVRASNTGGLSPYSNEGNATTNPGPPDPASGLTATPVNQTRIALVWTDNSHNEAGFKVERKTGAGAFVQAGIAGANATSFADTGLVANTEYVYRVRAYNVTANAAYTNEATGKTFPEPPAAPTGLTAGPLVNLQINLTWQDKSANEDSFRLERKLGAGGTFAPIAVLSKNATAFKDSALSPVTQYFYRVRASNLGGHSGYSNEATATTLVKPPTAPGNLTGTTASQTQINLAWTDNANDEDGFKIERKNGSGAFTEIASVAPNVKTYQDNGLSQDIEYVYRVRAFNAGGNAGYSNEVTAITLPNPPKAPVSLTVTPVSNKRINLAWADSSKNEAGFKIERKKGAAGTYSQIATLAANVKTYADSTLLPATQYFYRVRAHNIGGNSGYSNEANATTLPNPPKKPANLTATPVSNKRINLAWADSSNNETGFRIERKKGAAGTFAQIAQVNANVKTYADSTLTANSAYSYRVRAFNTGGNSLYSNEATATTLPNPPKAPAKLTATAVSKTRINLAWADSSNDETGFRIERKTGAAGTYAQVGSVNTNVKTYADTTLTGGTQYFYRVRAFNTGGNSAYSNEANAKTFPNAPAGPTALAATVAGGDQVTIAWQDNSNDEDGFKVESKLGADGTYTQVATVGPNVTNYESTGLTEGVTYFYRVRAFNLGGNSAYSNEASAIPSSGTNFALNKPAEASSTDSSSAVSRGNDGDGVSFWRSGFVNSANAVQTYQVQLHPTLSITVGRVVIKWYQTYYANEYDIQVSSDASNWITVHSALAVVTGTQDIPFTATPAKYVRLMTKKNNKSNYRMAEFEVYGATVAKTAEATSTPNEAIIPESLVLEQNYPNPFNPSTTVSFGVPEGMHVTLKVINAVGQEVATLVDGYRDRGMHRVTFNGRKLPSGVYYAVMKAGETTQTKRMVLAK